MPTIYILLPVYNRKYLTLTFIDSITKQTTHNCHLILIDDGSSDGTSDAVSRKISNLTILQGNGNLWWAGALQKGFEYLKAIKAKEDDVILIINDDTQIPETFIQRGFREVLRRERTIVRATQYCCTTKKVIEKGITYFPDKFTFEPAESDEKVNIANSNGLFIKWKDVMLIGDFMPKLLPHYLSDYEYTYRANRKGYKIFIDPGLKLYVNLGTSGFRTINYTSFPKYIKTRFSKKSAVNPIYFSVFVMLTSSRNTRVNILYRIWKTIIFEIVSNLLHRKFSPDKP